MDYSDMSLPPEEFLLNSINQKYKKNFTLDTVYFGDRIDVNKYGCESMIKIVAKPGAPFTGSINAYYNRFLINEFLAGNELIIETGRYFDTAELLGELLEQHGINLRRGDIISDIIDPTATTGKIRISNRSLAYRGYVPIRFTAGSGDKLLVDRVFNRILDGFWKN